MIKLGRTGWSKNQNTRGAQPSLPRTRRSALGFSRARILSFRALKWSTSALLHWTFANPRIEELASSVSNVARTSISPCLDRFSFRSNK